MDFWWCCSSHKSCINSIQVYFSRFKNVFFWKTGLQRNIVYRVHIGDIAQYRVHIARILKKNIAQAWSWPWVKRKHVYVVSFLFHDACNFYLNSTNWQVFVFVVNINFHISFHLVSLIIIILMVAIMKTISPSGCRSGGQIATWQGKAPLTMGTTKQPNVSQFSFCAFLLFTF